MLRGELHRRAVAERHYKLDDALAVARGSDQLCAAKVAIGTGKDFRAARRAAVNQNDGRHIDLVSVGRIVLLSHAVTPRRVDQKAVRKHVVKHLDARIHHAARVVAEVNDQALHALLLKIVHRFLKLFRGNRIELEDADVANLIVPHLGLHGRHLDVAARHVEAEFFVRLSAEYLDLYGRALFAADIACDKDIQILSGHIVPVNLIENIFRLKACLFRRGTREHGHDAAYLGLGILIQHRTDAGVLAAGLFGQLLVLVRRVVDRVGIAESRQHAFINAVFHFCLLLIKEEVLVNHILQKPHFCFYLGIIQILRILARIGSAALFRPVRLLLCQHPDFPVKQPENTAGKEQQAAEQADKKAVPEADAPHPVVARGAKRGLGPLSLL